MKLNLPVYFIGVGEQAEDLQSFNAAEFAAALTGADMAQVKRKHDMAAWRKTAEEFGPLLSFHSQCARRAMVWPARKPKPVYRHGRLYGGAGSRHWPDIGTRRTPQ